MARALEAHGFAALEEKRNEGAFLAAIERAGSFHLPELKDSIRRDLATGRLDFGQGAVRGVRDAVERLFAVSAGLDALPSVSPHLPRA